MCASLSPSHHLALAQAWCRWNGQRGTEKQALRVMRQLTAADLARMLEARGVRVVAIVPVPAPPAGPVVEAALVRQPDLHHPAQAERWYAANCPAWRKGGAQ